MAIYVPFNEATTAAEYRLMKRREKEDQRINSDSRKYIVNRNDDGKLISRGSRAQSDPAKLDIVDKHFHFADRDKALENPRFGHKVVDKEVRDGDGHIEEREWHYDKNKNMSSEDKKAFKDAKKQNSEARRYAEKVTKDVESKHGRDSYESQSAKDAARRHYRKTHRESCIFEAVRLI